MSSLTRGPLPPATYWRRRVFVLVLLVAVVGWSLAALGGGDDDPGAATTVADDAPSATPAPEDADEGDGPSPAQQEARAERRAAARVEREQQQAATAPLPEPTGRCSDADVVVSPVVEGAVAGADVSVLLNLRTVATEACTWQVSPAHLTVKITSGDDDIWSSQECPGRLERSTVTVRAESTSTTSLTWDAKRSSAGCPSTTPYAEPGYYHVIASALGGEPNDVQFELVDPRDVAAEEQQAEQEQAEQEQAEQEQAEQEQAEQEQAEQQAEKKQAEEKKDQEKKDQEQG